MPLLQEFFSDEDPTRVAAAIAALATEGPGPFDRSFGAVTSTDTHYPTPAGRVRFMRDGIFAPQIFGPERDFKCNCDALSGEEHAGAICERCGVVVGPSTLRSQRFGHIDVKDLLHPVVFRMLGGLGLEVGELKRVVIGKAIIRDGRVRELAAHEVEENDDLVGPAGVAAFLRASHPEHPALAFCSLTRIPVPPATARPLVTGLAPTMVDPWIGPLNELWLELVDCARRYLRLLELDAPPIILVSEQCRLQQAFEEVYERTRPPPILVPPLDHAPDELEINEALALAWLSPDALVVQQRQRVSIVGTDGALRHELPPAGCRLRGVVGGRVAIFHELFQHTHPAFQEDSGFGPDFVRRSEGSFASIREHVEISAVDCIEGRYLVELPNSLPAAFTRNDEPNDLFFEPTNGGARRKIRIGDDRPETLAYTNDVRFAWVGEPGVGTTVIDLATGIPHVMPIEPAQEKEDDVVLDLAASSASRKSRSDDADDGNDSNDGYGVTWGGSAVSFCDGEWRFVWCTGALADHRLKRVVRLRPAPRAAAFAPDGERLAMILAAEIVILALDDLRVTARLPLPAD